MNHLQGKAYREKQLVYLKEHLEKYYYSRDRKWIVLFPEGGFLRKRRETSQAFAKKNDLPHLTHVTLPRLGATQVILKILGPQQENGILGTEGSPQSQSKKSQQCLVCFVLFKLKQLYLALFPRLLCLQKTNLVCSAVLVQNHSHYISIRCVYTQNS